MKDNYDLQERIAIMAIENPDKSEDEILRMAVKSQEQYKREVNNIIDKIDWK